MYIAECAKGEIWKGEKILQNPLLRSDTRNLRHVKNWEFLL